MEVYKTKKERIFFLNPTLFLFFCTEGTDIRSNYLLNTTITGCEEADLVLLIGTNPRYEAPILNARLRKGWIHNELDVGVLGPQVDLSYDYEHLGDSTEALQKLGDGTHPFAKKLAAAKRPAVIVGSEMLHRPDAAAVMANVQKLAQNARVQSGCGSSWRVLNVLHKVAGQVSLSLLTVIGFFYYYEDFLFCFRDLKNHCITSRLPP